MNHDNEFATRLKRDVDRAIATRLYRLNYKDRYRLRDPLWKPFAFNILNAINQELEQL